MEPIGFKQTVIAGLANDGGLIIPAKIPAIADRMHAWDKLSYQELAFEIMRLYTTDMPDDDLRELVARGYANFDHPAIAPVIKQDDIYIQELFHGPTLAFKDIALQLLGNFFSHILNKEQSQLNILAATSGDTGSAAIQGVHGRENINIFVMHPHNRVSPLQEMQMTTVLDDNVFNLAIKGSFDDCQEIMKSIFRDVEFKQEYSLGSVNSVNWARVLAQIVYYFHAYFRVAEQTGADKVQFAVPTGNFGNILAGYYAARMGLPIERLILATNENNILSRFFNSGEYSIGDVVPTLSPSMDIQVASNFERYLFYTLGQDSARLNALMDEFRQTGKIKTPLTSSGRADDLFLAGEASRKDTLATIRDCHERFDYVPDPHTAVGIHVARQLRNPDIPAICIATAHPAKFNAAIKEAIGREARHPRLDKLQALPTRKEILPADETAVREYIAEKLKF